MTEVQGLLDFLLTSELALVARPVVDNSGFVSWPSAEGPFLSNRAIPSVADYRWWVESENYSAMLEDGSLLQLTYWAEGSEVVGHRLGYVPAPFEFDKSLIMSEPLLDVFDLHASGRCDNVILSSAVRFDYDAMAPQATHALSHFTFNRSSCRIPCVAPVRVGQFIDFVFRHFYPVEWSLHEYLRELPRWGWGSRTIREAERHPVHFSWRVE